MIGIVIVAHGRLAQEYLAALEHVVGPLEGVRAISVEPNDRLDTCQAQICRASEEVNEGQGVVLVTDMFGSTPSNLAMKACTRNGMGVLYGANMPMLVQLAKSRHLPRHDAVTAAVDAGHRYLDAREGPSYSPAAAC
ncbi:PTS system, mannose-specific IIA component [Monaibacterium marinum]|uniref:PTS system, mannose-specific IIA component n=1 Tax=Pontivivens marinum TaxID=1690039 RepID=A0A2C9CMM2_9RHOB|nr:PTS fructose transporter subunit IIA [Monaibacterium marinum]SOH92478.1 PTS system, mannose-specific IIA component [Monaibacterium marinum]